MRARLLTGSVLAAALALVAACSDRTEQKAREAGQEAAQAARAAGDAVQSAAEDTVDNVEHANDVARRDAAETAQAARRQGDAAKASIERAGERAGEVWKDASDASKAAAKTAEVKAALVADERVDAAAIDVDTDYGAKTVTLTGHVPSAAQKETASRISEAKAAGYRVKNELVVRR
jgi:hyperosmotically inducible periplasmic protein